ncbi:MAG: hypothetical protein ACE15E_09435 [Acidobacteriota bacterium]
MNGQNHRYHDIMIIDPMTRFTAVSLKSNPLRWLALWPVVTALAVSLLGSGPEPGDVFREFTYGFRFHELDPEAKNPRAQNLHKGSREPRHIVIDDLAGALRAEIVIEYWGGHIGTSGQRFRVNSGDWLDIPQPQGTPGRPVCYYRTLLRATAPLPLSSLKRGVNTVEFLAGPQLCHGFDWGFYWVYAFTIRVYYAPERSSVEARMVAPATGAIVGDHPHLAVEAIPLRSNLPGGVVRVDFIGRYYDFDYDGDGVFRDWQYYYERGEIRGVLGTATRPPYSIVWDTAWVPDQDQPIEVTARVTDSYGVSVMTRPILLILKRRDSRSVKMYLPSDVPEDFGARVGARKTCSLQIPDDLARATAAELVLSTWSAAHADEIGVNGQRLVERVGLVHNYSHDAIPVPVRLLRKGDNTFHIFSKTEEHAAEVNWPGPVLLVAYDSTPASHGPLASRPAGPSVGRLALDRWSYIQVDDSWRKWGDWNVPEWLPSLVKLDLLDRLVANWGGRISKPPWLGRKGYATQLQLGRAECRSLVGAVQSDAGGGVVEAVTEVRHVPPDAGQTNAFVVEDSRNGLQAAQAAGFLSRHYEWIH